MNESIHEKLTRLTDEERAILSGQGLRKDDYTVSERFIVNSKKILNDQEFALRIHTRFIDFPEHGHDYMELMYVYSGRISHVVNEEKVALEKGDILFINRHAKHSILRAEKDDIGVNFILSEKFLRNLYPRIQNNAVMSDFLKNNFDDAGEAEYLFFRTKDNFPACNLMENLIYAIVNRTEELYAELVTMLFSYLAYYRDTLVNALRLPSADARLKREILHYVDRKYAAASLFQLAAKLGYAPAYLSRRIRELFGKTFRTLLRERRMTAAEEMLRKTDLSVEEIIRSVGYENQTHFYREFCNIYGTTPYRYKRGLKK